jgi:hypothetical protein
LKRAAPILIGVGLAAAAALAAAGLAQAPVAVFALVQGDVALKSGEGRASVVQTAMVNRDGVNLMPTGDFGAIGLHALRLGSDVYFADPGRNRVQLRVGGDEVASADGVLGRLPAPVLVEGGQTLVAIRAAEFVGAQIGFDEVTKEVTLLRSDGSFFAISAKGVVRAGGAGEFRPARLGDGVTRGDTVRTREGRAELRAGGTVLRLDRNTEVQVTEIGQPASGQNSFFTALGRTWARVFGGQPTQNGAPGAVAAAKGTAWETLVRYNDEGAIIIRFRVYEGTIVITLPDGQVIELNEGEEYEQELGQPGVRRTFDREGEAEDDEFIRLSLSRDLEAEREFLRAMGFGIDGGEETTEVDVIIRLPGGN